MPQRASQRTAGSGGARPTARTYRTPYEADDLPRTRKSCREATLSLSASASSAAVARRVPPPRRAPLRAIRSVAEPQGSLRSPADRPRACAGRPSPAPRSRMTQPTASTCHVAWCVLHAACTACCTLRVACCMHGMLHVVCCTLHVARTGRCVFHARHVACRTLQIACRTLPYSLLDDARLHAGCCTLHDGCCMMVVAWRKPCVACRTPPCSPTLHVAG